MMNKMLIVGPAWVGDMVMAQCLFKLIKQYHPDKVMDVLAPAWSLPLLARMPEVSSAKVMPVGHGQLALKERYRLGKALREEAYQQAIILPNSFKSALVPFWARIPVRTGWRGEMRYGVLNDMRILDKTRYPLMIERYMALGLPKGAVLPKEYPIPELKVESISVQSALSNQGLMRPARRVLALCPGAEFGPAKRWPESFYAEVARVKLNEGWDVWLFGSPKDREVSQNMMALTDQRCIDLTGKTRLEEAIDLLSLADAVVANDSGLMHIAAALHKPLVAVYGPTSASFTPPLAKNATVLTLSLECQPCFQRECPLKHHRCMKELLPAQILHALESVV